MLIFVFIMEQELKDTYKTVGRAVGDVLFKDRGSKFIGYVYPVSSEHDIKEAVAGLKKKHYAARHWCYAWQLGAEETRYRVNDDGEPTNSAGQPIYGQLVSKELTNVLLVVVRYFGGTKLGVGGLVNAYRTTAKLTLEECQIEERTIDLEMELIFEYAHMNGVMRILKENELEIRKQEMGLNCRFTVAVRKGEFQKVHARLQKLRTVKIRQMS